MERAGQRPTTAETKSAFAGGSATEAIIGAGALTLAILGLIGLLPSFMAAIAAIAVGVALMVEGATTSARYRRIRTATGSKQAKVSGGMNAEFVGGAVGIALGILALLGIAPTVLLAIAAIVLGGTLLIGSMARPELTKMERRAAWAPYKVRRGAGALLAAAGIASLVLGLLGLVQVGAPRTFILISLLVLGAAFLLAGSALAPRTAR